MSEKQPSRRFKHRSAYSNRSYFNAKDFPSPRTMTIELLREEVPPNSDRKGRGKSKEPAPKLVAYFEDEEMGVVLNAENQDMLEFISNSPWPDDWEGLTIEVYCKPDVRNLKGEIVGGIRFRRAPVLSAKTSASMSQAKSADDVNVKLAEASAEIPY